MTSDHTSNAVGFQRYRRDNLTVLLLRQLRHGTPTAEAATKNSRFWGQNQVRDFDWDFTQPGQVVRARASQPAGWLVGAAYISDVVPLHTVVRGDTAALDATKGVSPLPGLHLSPSQTSTAACTLTSVG